MADILKIFDTNTKISGLLRSIPLEWHIKKTPGVAFQKILMSKTDRETFKRFATRSFLSVCTLILVFTQTIFQQLENSNTGTNIFAWLSVACLCTIISYFHLVQLKAPEVATLINGLVQFDQLHGKKAKCFRERRALEMISIYLNLVARLTSFIVPPFFVFGLHWQHPWKTSLAGYWLIYRSTSGYDTYTSFTENGLELVTKVIVCLFNYWVWAFGVEATCFVTPVVSSLSISIQKDNLNLFKTYCANNNTHKRAITYRHIQMLLGLINQIQRGPFILILILTAIFVPAFSVAALVKSVNSSILYCTTLVYISLVTIIAIFLIVGEIAALHVKSQQILQTIMSRGDSYVSRKE